MHRLTRADHVLFIEDQTIIQQGTYTELSKSEGAVAELMKLVEAAPAIEAHNATVHNNRDDATSSFVASLARSTDEIEAEMAAATSTKRPFKVYATAGGAWSFSFVLVSSGIMATLPGLIPVYVQVSLAIGITIR